MTNEKAIKMLEYIRRTGNGESEYKNDAQAIAIDMAIKALEQEPCEDAISRQAVLALINEGYYCEELGQTIHSIGEKEINALPPVTPTREHGEWIKVTNGRGGHECSQCGHYAPSYQNGAEHLSDFCPKCGADMRKEQSRW